MTTSRANKVTVTPLLGAQADGSAPRASLLRLGNVRILIDCGWDINFDTKKLELLKEAVNSTDKPINFILLSYSGLEHIGALPYVVGQLGLRVPIFCTLPTYNMGRITLYEAHVAKSSEGTFSAYTLDDVDSAFTLMAHNPQKWGVRTLKYSEQLTIRGQNLTITPYAAGHMIGGAIWRLRWHTDEIVYAVDMNHQGEMHLNGAALSALPRPSLLITDATNWGHELDSQRKRQEQLKHLVLSTLNRGGSVLIPTDAAGRSLELLLLLDRLWREKNLRGSYRLALVHSMAKNVTEFARSQIEWMNSEISHSFDTLRRHPFDLKHVDVCSSIADFDARGFSRPTVVLTTHHSLDNGPAKMFLTRFVGNLLNRILFTKQGIEGSLAAKLQAPVRPQSIAVTVSFQKRLQGAELEEHERKRTAARLQKLEEKAHDEYRRRLIKEIQGNIDDQGMSDVSVGGGADGDSDSLMSSGGQNLNSNLNLSETDMTNSNRSSGGVTSSSNKRRRTTLGHLFEYYTVARHKMFGCLEIDDDNKADSYGAEIPEKILAVLRHTTRGALGGRSRGGQMIGVSDGGTGGGGRGLSDGLDRNGGGEGGDRGGGNGSSSLLALPFDDEEVPKKMVHETHSHEVLCETPLVDMEGRSDGLSLRNMISVLAPHRLLIAYGSKKASDAMRASVGETVTGKAWAPGNGTEVEASLDSRAYDVMLHDSLVGALTFHAVEGLEVAFVSGTLQRSMGGNKHKAVLHPLPGNSDRGHLPLLLSKGELRILKLKHLLDDAKVACEVQGAGVSQQLICHGADNTKPLVVVKHSDSRLHIEGNISAEYFQIRQIIYNHLTLC